MENVYLQDILQSIQADPAACIREAEEGYRKKLRSVTDALLADKKRVVMLAGPSGSGKTTTAAMLAKALRDEGHPAAVVSLDDFYRNPEEAGYPRNAEGDLDFESVDALAVGEIHDCVDAILSGREYMLPRFDFLRGRRADTRVPLFVPEGGTVIIEGLHALNPRLTAGIDSVRLFRLFISVSTNILDEEGKRILSGHRVRFLRRLSRDFLHRNADAARTYELWDDVVAGEEKHLSPYRDTADCQLNTFHAYEVGVLRGFDEPLLSAPGAPQTPYIEHIRAGIARFPVLDGSLVPATSLLREFIA